MKLLLTIFFSIAFFGCTGTTTSKENKYSQKILEKQPVQNIYQIKYISIEGEAKSLKEYQGKVILIVNTASKCGYTSQYEGLEKIYQRYKDKGFVVVGFPCNQFFSQEPGTNLEIQKFCQRNYGVSFPLSEKIKVHGPKKHLLYAYLTGKKAAFPGKISWNFQKFLINRQGKVIARFGPSEKPESEKITKAIEKALSEK